MTTMNKNYLNLSIILIALLIALVLFSVWGTTAERINTIALGNPSTNLTANIQMVQVSDFHYKGNKRYLNRIISRINSLNPDLIFITGDLVESPSHLEGLLFGLQKLNCRSGIYAVPGNWEYWSRLAIGTYQNRLREIGITLLSNRTVNVSVKNRNIIISGLDDWYNRNWQLPIDNEDSSVSSYKIYLVHEPIMFDICTNGYNLMLAGHSHGGQIVLPLIGPLWMPEGCNGYWKGLYYKTNRILYVNSGLGTSIENIRFLARPEIALFILNP